MEGKLYFYKRNVDYVVGLRYFIGDNKGKALTAEDPYVAIEEEDMRDFKRANKFLLDEGLIIETSAPNVDDDSPNAISNESATELVKNLFALKKKLPEITSISMLAKLLETAKETSRSQRTIDVIQARFDTVQGEATKLGIDTTGSVNIKDGVKTYTSGADELKKAIRSK